MNRIMFIQYLIWHIWDVPKGILKAWRNFLIFNLDYFSVLIFFKTFFSHWHKYYYSYGRAWDPWRYFEAFIFNTFSRIIGAILRALLIIIGILMEIVIIVIGAIIFIGWLIFPALLIMGLIFGLKLCLI